MMVRPITQGDVEAVSALCMRAFNLSIAESQSVEGVATFTRLASTEAFLDRMQGDNVILVAEVDGDPVGIVELKEGCHVAMLFVRPDHQMQGLGKKLLASVLEHAKARFVSVSASPSSVPAYLGYGFRCKGGITEKSGLEYQPMELDIGNSRGPVAE